MRGNGVPDRQPHRRVDGPADGSLSLPADVGPILVVLLLGVTTDYSVFFLSGMRAALGNGVPAATCGAAGHRRIRADHPGRGPHRRGHHGIARGGRESSLGITLPAALVWAYPTITDLAGALCERMDYAPPADAEQTPDAEAGLSDEEMDLLSDLVDASELEAATGGES